jgi:tellurite resistance protein TehA-like permease
MTIRKASFWLSASAALMFTFGTLFGLYEEIVHDLRPKSETFFLAAIALAVISLAYKAHDHA